MKSKSNRKIIDIEATEVTSEKNLNNAATSVAATSKQSPFDDISKLRLSVENETVNVKKVIFTLPVRKPSKDTFIRVHHDSSYWLETKIIELKTERENYLVTPDLWQELEGEPTLVRKALVTTIDRQGVVFLWPVKLPDSNGKLDDWNSSALQAANLAKDYWIRVKANMYAGCYDVDQALADWGNPQWPEMPFNELLKIAFRDKYIDSFDHQVLRKLRGEI